MSAFKEEMKYCFLYSTSAEFILGNVVSVKMAVQLGTMHPHACKD